jgi:hypothetical protein
VTERGQSKVCGVRPCLALIHVRGAIALVDEESHVQSAPWLWSRVLRMIHLGAVRGLASVRMIICVVADRTLDQCVLN